MNAESGGVKAGNPQDPPRSMLFRWFKRNRHKINDFMARYSRISNGSLLNPADFAWTAPVAAQIDAIREEALDIYRHHGAIPPLREISPDHRGIIEDDSWRSFFLIGYGNRIEENIARAPRTAAAVSQIPGLNSAFFSIIAPGAHIVKHRGVTKAFITGHLGVSVPNDWQSCTMRVDKDHVHWREGEWTMFDDTYEHEVWNRTDEPRIVLLCQVERPLRAPGSWLAAAFMAYVRNSPFVQEAKDNLGSWEEAYRIAEANEVV